MDVNVDDKEDTAEARKDLVVFIRELAKERPHYPDEEVERDIEEAIRAVREEMRLEREQLSSQGSGIAE